MNGIEVKAGKNDTAEVMIYDRIGSGFFEDGVTAKGFDKELKALGKVNSITVRINSPGGSVWEGNAIYNSLRDHPARVIVKIDGLAASMASVIAMAGDEIQIAESGMLMIHNPSAMTFGSSDDMRKCADMMDKIAGVMADVYSAKTGKSKEEICQMMADETWLDAKEAVAAGFATKVTAPIKVAAKFDPKMHGEIPERFRDRLDAEIVMHVLETDETISSVPPEGEPIMADQVVQDTTPKAASIDEILAGCPGCDDSFVVAQMKAKATVASAQSAWMAEQNARLKASAEAVAAAKLEAENAKKESRVVASAPEGVKPLGGGTAKTTDATAFAGDPVSAWQTELSAKIARGMSRQQAVQAINRENPELRKAFVAASN